MKNLINRLLNLALYLVFCFLLGTGVIMEYRLPPGSGGRATVLGLSRHEWGDWHYNVSLLFLLLVFAHLWMNRLWLLKIAGHMKSWRVLIGLFAGAALILTMALLPVEQRGAGRNGGPDRGATERTEPPQNTGR